MEIIVNGSEKIILNPCSFKYSDYLALIERVEKYMSANIDPKSIISYGMEANFNVEAREKALSLVVSVAFRDGLIQFSDDNAVHHLFLNPINYDIYTYNEDDSLKFTVVKETGHDIDFSVKTKNLMKFLNLGSSNVDSGQGMSPGMSDDTYASCALYLALSNAPSMLGKVFRDGFSSIHTSNNDAHFASDFHFDIPKVMH